MTTTRSSVTGTLPPRSRWHRQEAGAHRGTGTPGHRTRRSSVVWTDRRARQIQPGMYAAEFGSIRAARDAADFSSKLATGSESVQADANASDDGDGEAGDKPTREDLIAEIRRLDQRERLVPYAADMDSGRSIQDLRLPSGVRFMGRGACGGRNRQGRKTDRRTSTSQGHF